MRKPSRPLLLDTLFKSGRKAENALNYSWRFYRDNISGANLFGILEESVIALACEVLGGGGGWGHVSDATTLVQGAEPPVHHPAPHASWQEGAMR